MANENQKDLFHGMGNETAKMPIKVKNKIGITDPFLKNKRANQSSASKTAKGWSK